MRETSRHETTKAEARPPSSLERDLLAAARPPFACPKQAADCRLAAPTDPPGRLLLQRRWCFANWKWEFEWLLAGAEMMLNEIDSAAPSNNPAGRLSCQARGGGFVIVSTHSPGAGRWAPSSELRAPSSERQTPIALVHLTQIAARLHSGRPRPGRRPASARQICTRKNMIGRPGRCEWRRPSWVWAASS